MEIAWASKLINPLIKIKSVIYFIDKSFKPNQSDY